MHRKHLFKWFATTSLVIGVIAICTPKGYTQMQSNTITFDNRFEEPALVKLVGPTCLSIEVPSGQSRTVNASAGEYYNLVRYGSDSAHYSYVKGDTFTVKETTTEYSVVTIALHKVAGGNYPTHPTTSAEFNQVIPSKGAPSKTENKTEYALHFVPQGNSTDTTQVGDSVTVPQQAIKCNKNGLSFFKQKRFQEAEEAFQKAIQIAPNYAEAHNYLGMVYADQKRFQEAEEAFQKAIQIAPNYAEAHNYLGMVYANTEKCEKAIEEYKKAVRIKPDYADAYSNLAAAYINLKLYYEAVDACHKALQGNEENEKAKLLKAMACLMWGRSINANSQFADSSKYLMELGLLEYHKHKVSSNPNDSYAHYFLGTSYITLGNYQEAVDELEKAINLDPNKGRYSLAYFFLGMAYVYLGDRNSALQALNKENNHIMASILKEMIEGMKK